MGAATDKQSTHMTSCQAPPPPPLALEQNIHGTKHALCQTALLYQLTQRLQSF